MKLTLQQLLAQFRSDARDQSAPYLWADEEVTHWLNEAENEAAVRRRLLHESDNPEICQIVLEPGKSTYPLHPLLYELTWIFRQEQNSDPVEIKQASIEWLDRKHPEWRFKRDEVLPYLVQDETTIRLATPPREPGILRLEGYRLPSRPMKEEGDTPEIHIAHHPKLVLWALFRAFSQPDSDGHNNQAATFAELEFSEYFGLRPDSDLRRNTREDVQQVNVAYI